MTYLTFTNTQHQKAILLQCNLKTMELVPLVKNNLVHYQMWKDVHALTLSLGQIICGQPPQKLSNDDSEITTEYVFPVPLKQYDSGSLTLENLDHLFDELQDKGCSRIVLAIVSDDGAVVYYTIYRGLHKPKKN
ncbi:Sen15p Ecym_3424 [Eremothecium cymbalariae DBVPG|uniref:tRNA-splicing endonuclease subunit Sen15 domain-containing protein n=1 Tax=Eremothecium cymbalariae (strain CBS 270.75 / DBVPG 7215 / KCTC 17166 / NRRL Y-17582) TaxID=931890 RepID=G8JRZ1_ERECY|nr:Hypothetical protein Ecym_3424 [Eremothecium cymbalariae DBVPG\